ncbi:hypothetical protein SEMRO_335_G120021.1 [Seminavis robusta]|uniref:Uncharacterized protein n=1 Tax=Seminavis robusta TaxID=568900 RepID=A0A9N8DVY8_9STRA|nr:hypothetical protein SEMRO_335_G120021.1 [Seminavis robusta]|eukprot:Sro335_g120021.1  (126) ;mRNA; r:18425-18802
MSSLSKWAGEVVCQDAGVGGIGRFIGCHTVEPCFVLGCCMFCQPLQSIGSRVVDPFQTWLFSSTCNVFRQIEYMVYHVFDPKKRQKVLILLREEGKAPNSVVEGVLGQGSIKNLRHFDTKLTFCG